MKIKMKKIEDHLPNLKKRLMELERISPVEIGYFPEQEDHSSGLSAAGLFNILHNGSTKNNLPARPIMTIGMMMNPIRKNKDIKMWLKQYLSGIHRKTPPITAEKVLENIGGSYVETFRGIFGSSRLEVLSPSTIAYKTSMNAPNPEAPLVFSGELMMMMSYKVNGVLVTPN